MRIQWKNVLITIILLCILAGVLLVEVAMFITGPNQKYEQDIASVQTSIVSRYEDIEKVDRHVFRYTTYHGVNDDKILWFDNDGNLLMKRDVEEDQREKALEKAKDKHHMEDGKVSLGYGYKNAVYIVKNKTKVVYYDFDSLKQIYYREETA